MAKENLKVMGPSSNLGRITKGVFAVVSIVCMVNLVLADETSSSVLINEEGYRYIKADRVQSEISVDGLLNEQDWERVSFQSNFLQREPSYGLKSSEETQIAILKDEINLYLGIKCYDSSSSNIIANEMRRDAIVDDDDSFELILDTFNDRRNGYYFIINPNGVKRDATLGDEGKTFNPDWDGIWDCATRITEEGWFAEIAIPWKTLRFDTDRDSLWSINFARKIRRKNEHVFWQLITLDAGRGGLFRISQAGYLSGLTNIHSSGNIDLQPYLLGGISRDPDEVSAYSEEKAVGLDATFALTSNLNLKLSWNTDFAQVESDQALVNLTRFSLYLPEKREFFLDGAEIFNFGGARLGRRGLTGNNVNLFYSRRIGIIDEYQQPIVGGVKLLGKIGSYQIGFLNMQTEFFETVEEDSTLRDPGANYSVFRIKKDIFKRSTIGVMLLNKHHYKSRYYNRSGGIDAIFPLTDSFSMNGNIAATVDPGDGAIGLNHKNMAGSFSIDYDSDLWEFRLSHLSIQENFNAEMGFIRRADIRKTSTQIEYSPRPDNFPSIRQFRYRIDYDYLTNQKNRLLESEIGASFSINFQNSSRFLIWISRETEYIDEDWEVRENMIIPEQTYTNWDFYLRASTDESKGLSTEMSMNYGDYYTGKRFSVTPGIVIKNIRRFRTDLDLGYNHVSLPDGKFDIRTLGCRLYYFLSTKLYLKAYLQWKDDKLANDGDSVALSNILIRWIYRPGSDLYLVYNEGWRIGPDGYQMSNRTLALKFTYFLRT